MLGRRRVDRAVETRILELKASGGILKIGRKLGVGTAPCRSERWLVSSDEP
jgi:hypothetical protein